MVTSLQPIALFFPTSDIQELFWSTLVYYGFSVLIIPAEDQNSHEVFLQYSLLRTADSSTLQKYVKDSCKWVIKVCYFDGCHNCKKLWAFFSSFLLDGKTGTNYAYMRLVICLPW